MTTTQTTAAAENQCVSIGFMREDGDFQILATLNNNDELLPPDEFNYILTHVFDNLNDHFRKDGIEVIIRHRQDAPDYVTLD